MDPVPTTQICSSCQTVSSEKFYFCPNCGKKLKEKPLSTSLAKQILIYSISFFLPPFGLSFGIKYLRQKSSREKAIGLASIMLTIISIAISLAIFATFMNSLSKLYNLDLENYQGLGL